MSPVNARGLPSHGQPFVFSWVHNINPVSKKVAEVLIDCLDNQWAPGYYLSLCAINQMMDSVKLKM